MFVSYYVTHDTKIMQFENKQQQKKDSREALKCSRRVPRRARNAQIQI